MGEGFIPEETVESIVRQGLTGIPISAEEPHTKKQSETETEIWVKDTRLTKSVILPKPNEALPRKGESGLIRTSYIDLLREGALEFAGNRYRIKKPLPAGTGAYGEVYEAFDERLRISVALKVGKHINNVFDFEREARVYRLSSKSLWIRKKLRI